MQIAHTIEKKLKESFDPISLEVINESHQHAGPRTESHFKVILSSPLFAKKSLVSRHQMVHRCLAEELKIIHALSLKLYTEEEWKQEQGNVPQSPPCTH